MQQRPLIKLLSLLLLLILQGCSNLSIKNDIQANENDQAEESWQVTQAALSDITRWSLFGKIGVRTHNESFTAAINQWEQSKGAYVIDLSSTFFGLGSTRLLGDEGLLTIIEGGEDPRSSSNPDLLIAESLGFPLPLNMLAYWIKGIPAGKSDYHIEYGEQGLPREILQAGWKIQVSKHQRYNNLPLPHKIKLSKSNTKITLAIKEWTINPTQTASH